MQVFSLVAQDVASDFSLVSCPHGGSRCGGPSGVVLCAFSRSGRSDLAFCKCLVLVVQEAASNFSLSVVHTAEAVAVGTEWSIFPP